MSGTNKTRGKLAEDHPVGPSIILVHPQLGQNIGTAARAMLNCGLTDLRLVKPRDGWPNERAVTASSGALTVIDNAKLFETTEEAVADLNFVLATTARSRDMVQQIYSPDAAADEFHKHRLENIGKCGVLFGPERSGLTNEDVALADGVLNVPLNPSFSSLNLAQAVLLMGFSWYSKIEERQSHSFNACKTTPASKKEINHMIGRLTATLDTVNFFTSEERRPSTVLNLKNMFYRYQMTHEEVNTFQGIISALEGKKLRK